MRGQESRGRQPTSCGNQPSTEAPNWEVNKIENLLGPLKMCRCDVVLNCYSIVVPLVLQFYLPFPSGAAVL